MIELDASIKHQEKVVNKIAEFKNVDKLLRDYINKFSEITTELSNLESELAIWQKEKEDLEKNPSNKEEADEWIKQIETIENNIKSKKIYLKELRAELNEINTKKEFLRENLKKIENDYIYYLKNQFQEYHRKSIKNESYNESFETLSSSLKLLKSLWEIQNKNSDLATFVKIFKVNEFEVDINLINELFDFSGYLIPQIVSEFLDGYLENSNINYLIDPSCKIGSLMFNLQNNVDTQYTAFLDDFNDKELINLLYPDKSITFYDNFDDLQNFPNSYFDIVTGFSGIKRNEKNNFKGIIDQKEIIRFLQASLKLKDDGIVFFILNSELRLNWDDKSVFTNLEKFDLYIDSIIRLAAEIFTDKDFNNTLLIIKRKKSEKLFIGELNNSSKDILLENLKKRKSCRIPQHGTLTELKSFYSFPNFLSKIESENLAQTTGIEPLKFKDVVKEVLSSNNFSETGKEFNYIFLPIIYNANAVLSSEEFQYKPEMYLQIFFDTEIVLAGYVARFYNTQLGKKIRESLNVGSALPRLSKKQLFESNVYLPDLENQIDLVRVDSLITELTTRAESYKLKLWNSPLKVSDIQKEIEDMDDGKSEKKFEQWIESLPYPLASILWCSITNPIYERKVKYLLHFFEAFSEFNMALLLSGLSSDENFFEVEVKRCFKDDPRFRNWYFKPTFGNWYKFGSCLSKTIRRLLEENETKCLEVFGNPDPEFLLSIANKDLITISEGVANYRNQWEGHGPVVSEKEYQNRYKILRSVLSRVYQILSDSYENTFLILPLQSSFHDGVHNYSIKRYMSTRAPFKPDNIETIKLMDKSKIYLAHENQRKPVELLPFVVNIDGACYFYNGRDYDTGKARYVSYHYHEKPEILLQMDKFNLVISLLKP